MARERKNGFYTIFSFFKFDKILMYKKNADEKIIKYGNDW